jgi:hypothetical protein
VGTEILKDDGAGNRPIDKKTEKRNKKMKKRQLNEMPFDKVFWVDGNEELCEIN